jgi:hypothetical protein
MDYCDHQNGVGIAVDFGNSSQKYFIRWPEQQINIEKIRNHYNPDDAIEHGAEAIAFFVSFTQTDFDCLQRSMTKTGIDYWLGYKNQDPNLPFQNAGRLEVSGILVEKDGNTLNRRIKTKIKQTAQSDKTSLPVYVVVVVFEQPSAKMVAKNGNS